MPRFQQTSNVRLLLFDGTYDVTTGKRMEGGPLPCCHMFQSRFSMFHNISHMMDLVSLEGDSQITNMMYIRTLSRFGGPATSRWSAQSFQECQLLLSPPTISESVPPLLGQFAGTTMVTSTCSIFRWSSLKLGLSSCHSKHASHSKIATASEVKRLSVSRPDKWYAHGCPSNVFIQITWANIVRLP